MVNAGTSCVIKNVTGGHVLCIIIGDGLVDYLLKATVKEIKRMFLPP